MKYFIVVGEASGDLHGANLIKAIKAKDAKAEIQCWGGDLMAESGAEVLKHYKELAFMGFIEVVANLRTILRNMKLCKEHIKTFKPDSVILIDYPGFNLRIAEYVKLLGVRVTYYISPQIWAWKQKRALKIKKFTDRVITILPFEKAFFRKFDMEVDYVGHPLLDAIENRDLSEKRNKSLREELGLSKKPIVAILPGSRRQEVSSMLPLMLHQIDNFPDFQFVVAAAPSLDKEFFQPYLEKYAELKTIENRTYDLLQISTAAMVTSGTATLETALFNVPEVVCYKGSYVSYQIARRLVKVDYISLVNLIMDKEIVRELIQADLSDKLLKEELGKLLHDGTYRQSMLDNFERLAKMLGGGGASKKAAQLIVQDLQKNE